MIKAEVSLFPETSPQFGDFDFSINFKGFSHLLLGQFEAANHIIILTVPEEMSYSTFSSYTTYSANPAQKPQFHISSVWQAPG